MPSLAEVAACAQGRLVGDADWRVESFCSLRGARENQTPERALCFAANEANLKLLRGLQVGAVILRPEHAEHYAGNKILCADPYLAYAKVSALFAPSDDGGDSDARIAPSAVIAADASVARDAFIGAHTTLGARSIVEPGARIGANCRIGDDCRIGAATQIHDNVCLYRRTRIGRRGVIAGGCVIGAPGFGYVWDQDEKFWRRIEQLAGVCIGDDVEIGALCTIDRGALDDTRIGDGVKLDNQVTIAHNVRIGEHTIMAGCVAVAGSVDIGKRCRFGGRASVLGQLQIADDVIIHALTCVSKSINSPGVYSAALPAKPAAKWRVTLAALNRLSELRERIKRLERAVWQKPGRGGRDE